MQCSFLLWILVHRLKWINHGCWSKLSEIIGAIFRENNCCISSWKKCIKLKIITAILSYFHLNLAFNVMDFFLHHESGCFPSLLVTVIVCCPLLVSELTSALRSTCISFCLVNTAVFPFSDQDLGSQEGYRWGPGCICSGEDWTHTVFLWEVLQNSLPP